jgi:pimeloyl-ACP methyl ester carboxylesterase
VKAANWLTHLEFDWRSPVWKHWHAELARDHRLIRYDERGCGLSDWVVDDFSFDAWVRDLETVTETLDLDEFPLLGISQGGPVAVEYAARHPDRVSHLILYGAYSHGWEHRDLGPSEEEEIEAVITLTREGWGRDSPMYRQIFTSQLMPDATPEQIDWFNDLQRLSTSPENAVRFLEVFGTIDVRDRLADVEVPTLVLHSREDNRVPFSAGRHLASEIPDSRFVPLDSQNHILLESEPAWSEFIGEVRRFLGVQPESPSRPKVSVDNTRWVGASAEGPDEREEARGILGSLDHLSLDRYTVVGGYRRFDERTRNALMDVCHRIQSSLEDSRGMRANYLIWAPPGSGKTYLVQQLADELPAVAFEQINFAEVGREEAARALRTLEHADGPVLCLIDEVDAHATADWPYETLLPWLDINVERGNRVVFALAGSSGSNLEELKERMASRPKGPDLLSRVPQGNEVVIPPMSVGDRILVTVSHLLSAAEANDRSLRGVEKLALYYVALSPRLRNARQLREFAVRAAHRLPRGENRVKYDHLFEPGDAENKQFWMREMPEAEALADSFVSVES